MGVLNTVGGVPYRGGVQYRGGYHEYRGGCSVSWADIMMHVGDIMSTVEGVQYRGGKSLLLFEYPTVLNTPTVLMISPMVLMISPTCIMISPHGTQISKDDIPHGTEHPHSTHDFPPRAS